MSANLPALGDIWREMDKPFDRYVIIVEERLVGLSRVDLGLLTVVRAGPNWVAHRRGRKTWANRERFNGKRGGYEFVEAKKPT